MAIIGFLFCFIVLFLFTLVLLYFMIPPAPSGFNQSEVLYRIVGSIVLGLAWYWLFEDITISIGGI